ncbi:histidine kinase [Halomonas korlensis]|uniref:Sensor protein n=1 Tax=Halomonas korlensis TaxID=463301 RepID=A0A1I7GV54_9GAMM|nr:type IV pili methyl-accepting chemotaxis transducer N-terminal domain-containing protein [Halomonas korlensis]SFU52323.1 two-component system, NarL family, nitrate/nitrite sensor histidine kinase NarX [Halomonas korlensis]
MKLLQRSLIVRIVASLLAVMAMTLMSIAFTMTIATDSRGDAAAINVAGSLRMNLYQIDAALQRYHQQPDAERRERLAALTASFRDRLSQPSLLSVIPDDPEHDLTRQYHQIESQWNDQVVQAIEGAVAGEALGTARLDAAIGDLAGAINQWVTVLEQKSEANIHLLIILQLLFLGFTAVVMVIAQHDIRHNLAAPLRQLLVMAREVAHRNFAHRTRFQGQDELARLGRSFDAMAEELSASYSELEARISSKKAELERSNQAMQVMHEGSRALYGGGNDFCASAAPMLRRIEELLSLGPIRLSLNDPFDDRAVPILATHSPTRPTYCRDHACHACLLDPEPLLLSAHDDADCLLLPVNMGEQMLGTLEIRYLGERPLTASTRRLLNILADQLATAIYLQRRIEEQQQVTLINERTIIARELHDSLAQSLSYLKMQVARLERMQEKNSPRETQSAVFDELRTGLNSAYRQLRELLTTFRLKLEGPGLQSALRQTIDEFSERMQAPIYLDFDVPPHLLNPNEEIHVLQLVREALANVQKHSQASRAEVSVRFHEARMWVGIDDDGIGLSNDTSPPMHYGLVIMRERADTLGGKFALYNRAEGGTRVELTFTPLTARLISRPSGTDAPTTAEPTHERISTMNSVTGKQ